MSEEERQAIIHLLDKQARYEYCIKNNISFSDEDYEAYIIRQSMINKDKEIERLNNIIKETLILTENTRFEEQYASDEILLPILNKLRESGIRNYIKVEGSDKE